MASKILAYQKDDGTFVGIAVDDTLYLAFGQANTPWQGIDGYLFDDFAAFQASHAGRPMAPNDFEPRMVRVQHLLGAANLIVPGTFNQDSLANTEDPALLDGNAVDIKLIKGEVDNNPEITFTP